MAVECKFEKMKPEYREKYAGKESVKNGNYNLLFCFTVAMMMANIGNVTEENIKTLYLRIHFYEKLRGAFRNKKAKNGTLTPIFYTLADIKEFIGLETNINYDPKPEPISKFLSRIWTGFAMDASREIGK